VGNHTQTYALHDSDERLKKERGCFRINRERDAARLNQEGYGIFQTANCYWGKGGRNKSNFKGINCWFAEIDGGDKPAMLEKLKRGLTPTMIVESKNGFHAYWKAKDATPETWTMIMKHRLIPFYGADKKAADMARILRAPGFFHMKDPAKPFLVKKVWSSRIEYTEMDMLKFYPDEVSKKEAIKKMRATKKAHPMQGDFWDRVWNLNCEYALEKLSGSAHVGFEVYGFKENSTGTKNILVNGKSTSCWVDIEGRIGSGDGGGPSIAQWLNWFHKDYAKVVQIIKEVFPECQPQSQQLPLI
jgi:hypothetical protein